MPSRFSALLGLLATLKPAASFTPSLNLPSPLAVGSGRSRFAGRRVKGAHTLIRASGGEYNEDAEAIPAPSSRGTKGGDVKGTLESFVSSNGNLLPVLAAGAVAVVVLVSLVGGFADSTAATGAAASGVGTLAGAATTGLTASEVYDPRTFQPVCGVSDNVYRYLQGSALVVVGKENYETYAPLIAGGILRVRLELCVLESFVNEAIVPFVREKGLSWVLPFHETVETFLAGTVFAIATNFILLGSTKIVAVLVAYLDVFFGLPSRLLGRALWDQTYALLVDKQAAERDAVESGRKPAPGAKKPRGGSGGFFNVAAVVAPKPAKEPEAFFLDQLQDVARRPNPSVEGSVVRAPLVGVLALAAALRLGGATTRVGREACELLDTFVGRYLVYATFGYVTFKVLHFKVFNSFPPF